MDRIDIGGHALSSDSAGAGPPDFVCLHGLIDSLEVWDALALALAERGRVVRRHERRPVLEGLLRGQQRRRQQAHKLDPSMSRRGNCWDNAVVESFFSSLKK